MLLFALLEIGRGALPPANPDVGPTPRSLWQKCGTLAKMVTSTKFRDDRSRGFLYLPARKFQPVTTFAESTISATGC
jgi:hypothetical protein